ncbi:hypothetical protein Aduo_016515 [Ancylostoma duodenale]
MPTYVVVVVIIMLSFNSVASARSNDFVNIARKHVGMSSSEQDYTQEESKSYKGDITRFDEEGVAPAYGPYNVYLPKNLKPLSYNLVIKVYLPNYVEFPANKNLTTEGEVTINMVVMHDTNVIVLNMKNIILITDKCDVHSGKIRLTITRINIEDQLDRVIFVLAETLHVGQEVSLKVTYAGKIDDKLDGLYQTTYNDSQGKLKIAAVSKCEPISARKIVPCFDEPEYKAVWNVTIVHPIGTRAIANALELKETTEADGLWKVSRFHPTPILASYLLALFVSEFDYEESYTKRGVRFRVWSAPNTREKRSYGLKAAITLMELFEEYFGVQDIAMKQDLVALPDFGSGAMENWGLITFRERLLLADGLPKQERQSRQQRIIAHELAHQITPTLNGLAKESVASIVWISMLLGIPVMGLENSYLS